MTRSVVLGHRVDGAVRTLRVKGKAITVSGSFTRRDWVKQTYTGSRGVEGPAAGKAAPLTAVFIPAQGHSYTTMEGNI